MELYLILLSMTFNFCFCDWILLPSIPTHIKSKKQQNVGFCETPKTEFCSDWHNLTSMYFAKSKKETNKTYKGWELRLQDAADLYKEYQSIPKQVEKKINFVTDIQQRLAGEADYQLNKLFSSENSRQARTYFYYPSMESSLMTVSMLLFGVYLTKVILRLLQSHYSRYNNVGVMGGIRGPIRIIKGRRKRSVDEELKKFQLMYLVEKFNAQFN